MPENTENPRTNREAKLHDIGLWDDLSIFMCLSVCAHVVVFIDVSLYVCTRMCRCQQRQEKGVGSS